MAMAKMEMFCINNIQPQVTKLAVFLIKKSFEACKFFLAKGLTKSFLYNIIAKSMNSRLYRGMEQLVARRAHNPKVVRFESHSRNHFYY